MVTGGIESVSSPMVTVKAPKQFKQQPLEAAIARAFGELHDVRPNNVRLAQINFDMSDVQWFDLDALLWQIVLLSIWRRQRNNITLFLPNIVKDNLITENHSAVNAWSFLRRWRYFEALAQVVDDPLVLLPPDQIRYVVEEPSWLRYQRGHDYLSGQVTPGLISDRLVEITVLPASERGAQLGEHDVQSYMMRLEDRIVLHALARRCRWSLSAAETFVNTVLGEGLRNSALHAGATFAVVAMRIDHGNLILAIADDGQGIPETLRHVLSGAPVVGGDGAPAVRDSELIKLYADEEVLLLDSNVIKQATEPGTTSTPGRRGLGLFYVKQAVLQAGGRLTIRSGSASVEFMAGKDQTQVTDDLTLDTGTMLRIIVPIDREHAPRR